MNLREIVRQARRCGSALAVAVAALGFVSNVGAAPPRRGMPMIPQRPANIDSTPMINDLNKALRVLNATDLDYGGHREKAISHVVAAIGHLGIPNANPKGRSSTAAASVPAAKTAPSQEASDAALHKARKELFATYHQLKDHASTRGRIQANAEVKIAIDEIDLALKSSTPAAAPTPATTTTTTTAPAARTPAK